MIDGAETYPNPHNTDPATRDRMDAGEAPVAITSNDGGNELSHTESAHKSERRAFHEEESVRPSDEDERLRDDGNLKVNDHVKLLVIGVQRRKLPVSGRL